MKLILSRKGFDSSSGGCPSPIFADGSLLSLPIPDERSSIRFRDLHYKGPEGTTGNYGDLIEDLCGKSKIANGCAHLDPDLVRTTYPRQRNWRPLLGQSKAAQGHLANQGVGPGDLFVFFGLFRAVENHSGHWRFIKSAPPQHIIWGWLQIEEQIKVDELSPAQLKWTRYHPHCQHPADVSNTLYISSKQLTLPGYTLCKAGAGVIPTINSMNILSMPDQPQPSRWQLPVSFYPEPDKPPLSYHANLSRWKKLDNHCQLQSAFRGQEFVLDTRYYPECLAWLVKLLRL